MQTEQEDGRESRPEETLRQRQEATQAEDITDKDGFYTPEFLDGELASLKSIRPGDTSAEIDMLRVVMRRMLVYAAKAPECSEAEMLRLGLVLERLGRASEQLARLIRMQKELAGGQSAWPEELQQALREVRLELNLL